MPSLIRTDGIVLRSVRHGETSLILTVFSMDCGRIALMAKGARAKAKSGSSGGLEPFGELQFVFYHKAGRDLQMLKEWSVLRPHIGLRTDFGCLAVASAVLELLLRCTRDDDPHPELYAAASAALSAIDANPSFPLSLLWMFELCLFRSLGFAPQFDTCCETGRKLSAPFAGPLGYRLGEGSFMHPDVREKSPSDGKISAESFALIASLNSADTGHATRIRVSARSESEISSFLSRYLETHLPVRGKLRSLDALHWGQAGESTPSSEQKH